MPSNLNIANYLFLGVGVVFRTRQMNREKLKLENLETQAPARDERSSPEHMQRIQRIAQAVHMSSLHVYLKVFYGIRTVGVNEISMEKWNILSEPWLLHEQSHFQGD